MDADEEIEAATALADNLTSAMFRAHDIENRRWLYGWELRGYRWLLRFRNRRPDVPICGWSSAFMRLNRDALLSGATNVMDFNLRDARLREEAEEALKP